MKGMYHSTNDIVLILIFVVVLLPAMLYLYNLAGLRLPVSCIDEKTIKTQIESQYIGKISDLQSQLADAQKTDWNAKAIGDGLTDIGITVLLSVALILLYKYWVKSEELKLKRERKK
jgi:hypothetical protein